MIGADIHTFSSSTTDNVPQLDWLGSGFTLTSLVTLFLAQHRLRVDSCVFTEILFMFTTSNAVYFATPSIMAISHWQRMADRVPEVIDFWDISQGLALADRTDRRQRRIPEHCLFRR